MGPPHRPLDAGLRRRVAGELYSIRTAVSDRGRFVAYRLQQGASNGPVNLFVWDRTTGVSTSVATGVGYGGLAISSVGGRFVAYQSPDATTVAGDANGFGDDVFVWDRVRNTTERVSWAPDGGGGNNVSASPSISDDGRLVAFSSDATNLVSGLDDDNAHVDVFVRDRGTGVTRCVSVAADGSTAAGDGSFGPFVSGDGESVAFSSHARDWMTPPSPDAVNTFAADLGTGAISLLSHRAGRVDLGGNGDSFAAGVAADGRTDGFWSSATDLTAEGDTGDSSNAFLSDR